ncbi:MAG: hypothetical protein M3Q71_26045, partial [Chloroflexota bacterium]|nr:hypothetical protein [Chloroflexota bacterium]
RPGQGGPSTDREELLDWACLQPTIGRVGHERERPGRQRRVLGERDSGSDKRERGQNDDERDGVLPPHSFPHHD